MQSKQQSTEKTGVDVWPNVSLTRAELRSKVRCLWCKSHAGSVLYFRAACYKSFVDGPVHTLFITNCSTLFVYL